MNNFEVVSFDMDSTLVHTLERAERLINKEDKSKTDWLAYAMASGDDPATSTIHLARFLNSIGVKLVIVTFRPNSARDVTQKWLEREGIRYEALVMGEDNSTERPVDFKVRAVGKVADSFDVKMHFDDSWEICEAIQDKLGIPAVCVRSYAPEKELLYF